jgi:hypothetical protein
MRDRHRDIVLDRPAFEPLGLDDRFANAPDFLSLRFRCRNGRIAYHAVFKGALEEIGKRGSRSRSSPAFDEDIPRRRRGKGIAHAKMADGELKTEAGQKLEGGDLSTCQVARQKCDR